MKPTPAQIDEQVSLERDQISQGLKRLRDNTNKLENSSYASASIYGVASINDCLPRVITRIDDTYTRIQHHTNGPAFKEIYVYLQDIEALALASIACKITFDKVFSYKDKANLATNVIDAIGSAIEAECQMRHYEKVAPGLLNSIKKNYWHKSIGTEQKFVVSRTLMNRYGIQSWNNWGSDPRKKLGGWLLDCIMEGTQWFDKYTFREGKKTSLYIMPTAEFMDIKDEVMSNAELYSPLAWPMLVPPKPWSNDEDGGYLLNEVMHGHEMVRRGSGVLLQGEKPLEFLNRIQAVGYRLNPFVVEVAETLQERRIEVGKFLPITELPLPPKPVDIAENYDARKSYRRQAAEAMNSNAQSFRRSCRTRMTMEAVSRFKSKERWYIPWSFDYRGRAYPIPAFLTPQDTDFGKSLIRFADESYMTSRGEEWLAFQVATTYGLDKATWNERQRWAFDNFTLIKRVALDPIGNIGDWEGAEEPWQFLAACEEFYHCVINKDREHTGLLVACDATCSGLQILAGLAMDKSTAELVNVLPSDRPQDAYKTVAGVAKWNCPDKIMDLMDRKVVKRTVMTIPYNAKPHSNRAYIRDALKEKGIEISNEDLTQTVKAVREAMNRVVPGPMKVMEWIENEVASLIRKGVKEIKWITPSGFVVSQTFMKRAKPKRIRLQLLGSADLYINEYTDKADISRHKAATAPNLIHSLDASLLCLSTINFNSPIATIHDSVSCLATDMDELSRVVRKTYMHLFAENNYLKDFANQIGAETEPPIIGDLEPSAVIDSTYFFC